MFEKFNYYGYDKTAFRKVLEQVSESNALNTGITLTLFIFVMAFASVASIIGFIPHAKDRLYISFFVISLVYQIILLVLKKFRVGGRFFAPLMYGVIVILVVFSVLSSIDDVFQIAVVYPAFILVCGVAFMDQMFRFSAVVLVSYIAFTYASFMSKTPSIARYDMIYATIFTILCLVFHFRFQNGRMSQFMSYQENLEIQRDLEVQSSFDTLSSLLVRGRFFSLADSVLRRRNENDFIVLCILDLDAFKQINDKYGHQMGDKAIQVAADTIWKELDADLSKKWDFCEQALNMNLSFAGRLGGDEFVIFLREPEGWDATVSKLRHILDSLNGVKMGELNGIQASFGVTKIRPSDNDIDVIYARADSALYTAKASGKNQIVEG
ncbi:MAG: GGDEF domain-containing protein [Lachnospiraceae bacterium]|nr:GGDEF domain-containing protein [Lachnospiraceae bacterium]